MKIVTLFFCHVDLSRSRSIYETCTLICQHRVEECVYPRTLDNQQISEVNQKLRLGCPPDCQIICGKIKLKFSSQLIF